MRHRQLRIYFGLLLAVLAALSAATFQRNLVWQTRISLWEDVTSKSPRKARAYYNLAVYPHNDRELSQAWELYSLAIMLDPKKTEALVNRGNIYDDMGLTQQALKDYNTAIEIDSMYKNAYYNRARTYERLRLFAEARADYQRSCDLGDVDACSALKKLTTASLPPVVAGEGR